MQSTASTVPIARNRSQLLERTFNGLPMLLKYATGAMYGLKQWMIDLMAMDLDGNSIHAGPSFEWVPPEERVFPGTQIWVLPRGPYVMRGDIDLFEAEGKLRKHGGVCVLCRCGGSRTKPFCDGTHLSGSGSKVRRAPITGSWPTDVKPIRRQTAR